MKQYLVIGRTGAGKSSLINHVIGQKVTETSEYVACTRFVSHYILNTPEKNICLIDTPGLCDEIDESYDIAYLNQIISKVNLNHLYGTLYVTPLNDYFRSDDMRAFRLLDSELGSHIWANCKIVFTFSMSVPREEQINQADRRIKQIENYFSDEIKKSCFLGFSNYFLIDCVKEPSNNTLLTALLNDASDKIDDKYLAEIHGTASYFYKMSAKIKLYHSDHGATLVDASILESNYINTISSIKSVQSSSDLTNLIKQLEALKIKVSRFNHRKEKYRWSNSLENEVISKLKNIARSINEKTKI
ncbi:50S ribosome-binding GTPase [Candidatus Synechococcus calcipolaris G9]|uniref:50S ribosome-binding GTPase n=1 Tax=Candidatus Synechococcus calcipolaris G9 TaxID=1497997 RepID=A0ABT6F0T9_9SYNE|nr:GTPase [Candidatus Synechococcus calcipolaris]MDG2991474.1 50S ribosome-binding GTPase [Candidatus Synechococcus calcipolaris G9]